MSRRSSALPLGRVDAHSMALVMTIRIPWTRVVELAEAIEREYSLRGVVDADLALRLVRAVLQFQEQLVAGMVKSARGP